ncbi:Glycerate kinase [Serratia plymuthica]|uniref:Glycerate kinase n=1 Tax=Serratia plymuthica S13 TaxID=1348660 RepID=S4YKL4_SERPL|nr:glycerate kinase [Serratia plymuthica]AGP43343.1 glycerate kinase [Serratia plymuthica S13]KYG18002.1 Glycerate kinase [Serratia plymuthica]QPS89723.1 glycerate kinase [Serratia plymuthica]QQT82768.1 glycerate kinase [Serratia plymuthica]
MKVVIVPDSFKESVSAELAALAIARGFREVYPDAECICLPIADGGEGTVDALIAATCGHKVEAEVTGPLGNRVAAFYGVSGEGKTAVIEMAAASGLMLVPAEQRNPMLATSYGTGELIRHALDLGIRHIILGIGGSATVDGGVGMMQALGGRFYRSDGMPLSLGGAQLAMLSRINLSALDDRLRQCKIEVACDVDNPLVGPRGAAAVFGPQKGATPAMVVRLEQGLEQYAAVIRQLTGSDVRQVAGGGAAGGMGIATQVLLGAELKPGIDIIMEALQLENVLAGADVIVTGEGRIDRQTLGGKALSGIARLAQRHRLPVIALAGVLGEGAEVLHSQGIDAIFSILPRLSSLDIALSQGEINLQQSARNIARVMQIGQRLA